MRPPWIAARPGRSIESRQERSGACPVHGVGVTMTVEASRGSWAPLLAGGAAASAMATVEDIAQSLSLVANADGPSLGRGSAGISLFFAYLSRTRDRDANARAAVRLVEAGIRGTAASPDPSLYAGLAGPAWVMDHLVGWILDRADPDPGDPVDAALSGVLRHSPWVHDFDLIAGLVGMGFYALGRLPRPRAVQCLELVVDRLAETAECREDGLTWLTRPELLPDGQRQETPDGYYDVGVAHGVPGVVSLLGSICAAGVAPPTASRLLDGAVSWLLAQRFPPDDGPVFPVWIAPDAGAHRGARHWCYGDPGVAAAIFAAGRATGHADWESAAVDVALRSARRGTEGTRILDAGLCHGTAGLGHIYNRLWHATGEMAFCVAARSWFELTPELLQHTPEAGFLTGRAGVGLALLSALGLAPDWDVVLALSSPRRG